MLGTPDAGSSIAGKLEKLPIPEFSGIMSEYQNWKKTFHSLTQSNDPESKKAYLESKLKGKAYQWVESLISSGKDLETIWVALDSHFGDSKHIVDSTICKLFTMPPSPVNMDNFVTHFTEFHNAAII